MEQTKKGFSISKLFESRVKTRTVSTKEKILGHLIGPLGLIFIVNTIAALVEKFFTQQTGLLYGAENIDMVNQMGKIYGIIMTIVKILSVVSSLLISFFISRSKSKNGRFRPLYPIFGFITLACGFLVFLFPGNPMGGAYWYYFFIVFITYHVLTVVYFNIFRDNIVSVSTRSPSEKYRLNFVRKVSWTIISGIIIGLVVNNVILPYWLDKDINGYALLMISLSIASIPLIFLEFYYTKERIVEEDIKEEENTNKIPIKEQLKALFTNKYYIIVTLIITMIGICDNFKGGNVQYFYIKYLLDGENKPLMYTLYMVAAGSPVGIGAIAIYPLAKKFGIKNVTIAGYICVLVGSVFGWIFPSNPYVAVGAGFLRNLGMIPNSYVFTTLLYYAFDSIEAKTGYRLEGLLGTGIVFALQNIIYAPFAGGYESGLLQLGFVDKEGVTPSTTVINFIVMSFYLFDIILAVLAVSTLPFVDVEKKMKTINETILARKKEKCLAEGKEWIDPEVLAKQEEEQFEKEREENRILDLKERCEKKGLDFEVENQKYLDKQAKIARKKEEKEAKKLARKNKKE
ncbi:MAG: MFS transporter [Bacilli bacterium]|nr:MFS transporter [Bacilli bacterium]MBO6286571.1 MFS transporter [Bacilli bacterium]